MDERLAVLHDLVRADEERSAALTELDRLLDETVSVRARAAGLTLLLDSAPSERSRLDGEVTAAEREVHARSEALAEAERELAHAEERGDEERLAAARRFVVRARDALSIAEKRAAASRAEAVELERRLHEAELEAPRVEALAASLAVSLRGRPRLAREAGQEPAPGLDGVADWAGRARAALVVARSGLAAERDAVIRQANELASVVLGEPLVAASAADVARRVEQALGRGAG